ncbi:HD domain-containing protein [Inconstantimicrobium mannanitabidum]|uniref:Uncharacterized protein n=1 Tax=Inconstantimicrobium mannanitabidum TaxID=1604901 RepID=A0ACB5REQ2_9CLOT|nr:HD domain-containing protein [Clostridium sp. TW13]GKX67201.1 hypothetical protein rsdtw13_24590 [Clostridium sp. TW13]
MKGNIYDEMFQYVKQYLEDNDGEVFNIGYFPFRKRSEHIKRVLIWTQRLMEEETCINKEAVLVSAIFHDIGYALSLDNSTHAQNSAVLCDKYLKENGYKPDFINFVTYLVENHSNKELMKISDTPLELIILMEADLLDETGALSVVWDCMMEGSQDVQSFEKTYKHILKYSYKTLSVNPMITPKAKEFWKNKQDLMQEFIRQLSFDLDINF